MGWGMKSGIHAEYSGCDVSAGGRVSAGIFFAFFFNRGFARVSPVFAVAFLSAALAAYVPLRAFASDHSGNSSGTASADPGAAERRQAASSQFAHAEEQRTALNNKPPGKRTLNDYKQVVSSYRRVYLITPHAAEVPDSLLVVAELYTEMGDRFGRAYYQSAVDSYQFLLREYPNSRYIQDAYLRSAKLQKDQLGDTAGATKTYDDFLKKFPHSKSAWPNSNLKFKSGCSRRTNQMIETQLWKSAPEPAEAKRQFSPLICAECTIVMRKPPD